VLLVAFGPRPPPYPPSLCPRAPPAAAHDAADAERRVRAGRSVSTRLRC